MSNPTISIAVVADVQRAQAGFKATGDSATRMGREVESAGHSFDELGEKAGTNASRASQLAGALGDIAGTATDSKGAIGAVARAVEGAAPFVMVAAGAFDILELALTSSALASVRNAAATVASRTAMIAGTAATYALTTATLALDAAMAINPVVLVVVAIVALVAALVLAYTQSEKFRTAIDDMFSALKDSVLAAVQAITDAVDIVVAVFSGDFDKIPALFEDLGKSAGTAFLRGLATNLVPGGGLLNLIPGFSAAAGTVSASAVSTATDGRRSGGGTYNTTIVAPSGNAAEIGRVHASYLANRSRIGGLAQ